MKTIHVNNEINENHAIQVVASEQSKEYLFQAIAFLEEANAKLSVAKTILESQTLVDDKLLFELIGIQNQIEDFHKHLNQNVK